LSIVVIKITKIVTTSMGLFLQHGRIQLRCVWLGTSCHVVIVTMKVIWNLLDACIEY